MQAIDISDNQIQDRRKNNESEKGIFNLEFDTNQINK